MYIVNWSYKFLEMKLLQYGTDFTGKSRKVKYLCPKFPMVRNKYDKEYLESTEEWMFHIFYMCKLPWLLGVDHANSVETIENGSDLQTLRVDLHCISHFDRDIFSEPTSQLSLCFTPQITLVCTNSFL